KLLALYVNLWSDPTRPDPNPTRRGPTRMDCMAKDYRKRRGFHMREP
ncbi:MAG: hypothetical protein ACI9OU_001562, partial [Candidatus Promineifilaceae bacterium]